jgi:quercetin dioxygenase-like cupin family protein
MLVALSALAQPFALRPLRLTPESLSWKAGRNGAEQAVVAGDDTKPGLYSYQLRIPAGTKVAPHFHSGDRIAVVLSGTFYVGYGDRFDEGAMKALPAGSAWVEPNEQAHYAWAKDGDVVLHVVGVGPLRTTQIPPSP